MTEQVEMTEREFNIRCYILQLRLDKKTDSHLDTEKAVSFLLDTDFEPDSAFVGKE